MLSQFIQIIDSTLRHHCLKYAEEKLDPWDINGNYLRKDLMVKYILRNVVSIFFLLALIDSVEQDNVGFSSIHTLHSPQHPVSQPLLTLRFPILLSVSTKYSS